ncbi:MAG: excinuclease ABC subunit UvrA [Erysipelotrichaceae bacterium]|nr:excinuclease ABC subunit UvrA [Erysipelotrichaceae bacterium]
MNDKIVIRGARENNLKNINLELPRNSLIVMTGLSGSGKTSLAFDTIFAEGQRRYVESLSPYARQFLGGVKKPDVDSIEGLSPSISIDQKTTSHNPRSTVGTVTEIYDYLRLLYARIGIPYCPTHNIPIVGLTISEIKNKLYEYEDKSKMVIMSPIVYEKKGSHKDLLSKMLKNGFIRAEIDGQMSLIEDYVEEGLDKNKKHTIFLVIDRLVLNSENNDRIVEALELACKYSNGIIEVLINDNRVSFSTNYACKECGFSIEKIDTRLFSFNAPQGACNDCKGLGIKMEVDPNVLVENDELSINQGAISYFKHIVGSENLEWQEFEYLCKYYNIDMNKPFKDLSDYEKQIALYGSDIPLKYTLTSRSGNMNNKNGYIEGPKRRIERLFIETQSSMLRDWYFSFMMETTCTTCNGNRLNEKALSVKINNLNIAQLTNMQIVKIYDFINNMVLTSQQKEIAKLLVEEIKNRLQFLINVGLDYLTLSRMASTLSGGEAQRIRLATQIGSKLTGVLYVLDEPSIGLHQKDNDRLIETMKKMRDLGNTLIVVEHDEDTMRNADYLVDIGPGAGIHGGNVVACGTPSEVMKCENSITAAYLSKRKKIAIPNKRRKGNGKFIEVINASENNLKNIDVKIPLNTFTIISGVSGSGKSTLINETLYKGIYKVIYKKSKMKYGKCQEIKGIENIDKIINVTQEPIGRSPRSNPATYTGVFDFIRDVFAQTIEAKERGYDKGRFSFNVKGGRCEKCEGDGVIRVPMHFLPDVYVPCELCNGKRYNEDTLKVKYKGKSIYDVLEMTIEEAYAFFNNHYKIANRLKTLIDVGLGYVKVGQNALTLSGGEAQRVKLAYELQKKATGKTLFILDEPTTGLHTDDVRKLIDVINRIVDNGDSVIMIEHNLDMIKVSDYIIDLGPNGGDAGGCIVGVGTPEELSQIKQSYTGQYLKKVLDN